MSTLLLCPMCGDADAPKVGRASDICDEFEPNSHSDFYQIVCSVHSSGCGASGGFKPTQDEAIAAWNLRAALDRATVPAVPVGMRLVPVEPTPEMVTAGERERLSHPTNVNPRPTWFAMLNAAPLPSDHAEQAIDERTAFETCAKELGYVVNRHCTSTVDRYYNNYTSDAWKIWQARAALEVK